MNGMRVKIGGIHTTVPERPPEAWWLGKRPSVVMDDGGVVHLDDGKGRRLAMSAEAYAAIMAKIDAGEV